MDPELFAQGTKQKQAKVALEASTLDSLRFGAKVKEESSIRRREIEITPAGGKMEHVKISWWMQYHSLHAGLWLL